MSILGLVGTGITLGVVHVLTGPDHLSALSTLSASKQWLESWWLGIRWGVGHSTGLLVVGSILIWIQSAKQDEITVPKTLTRALETCVGVFMLGLGVYGIWQAVLQYRQESQTMEDPFSLLATTDEEIGGAASLSMADVGDPAAPISQGENSHNEEEEEVQDPGNELESEGADELLQTIDNSRNDHPKSSTGLIALLAGLVHGVAGPGGILGVIPAVQIRDPLLGSIYLGTFCLTSTLTMGCYAAMYGTVSRRLGDCGGDSSKLWKFRIQLVSACISFLVGLMWLVLLALGKLEDVFG